MGDLVRCSTALRTVGEGCASMEEVAAATVGHLRGHFVNKDTGQSAMPLVRFYVTQRTDQLEPELQDFARAAGTDARAGPDVVCLTLLATSGEEAAWNDRRNSVSHRAIPLPSVEALQRLPMVSQLFGQLGLEARHVIRPDPTLHRDLDERAYDVFFVPEARNSPFVPDQDAFVIPFGIRSVLGFGGVLLDGSLFAVVLFSEVPIPQPTLDAFAAIGLSVKIAILPFVGGEVFAGRAPAPRSADEQIAFEQKVLQSKAAALAQLLDVRASVVEAEAIRLERMLIAAEERAEELAASRAALAQSEARKTAIVEGAFDCVIGMESNGRITDFNRAAESTFGYERQEVIGELLAEVIIPYSMRERHRSGLAHVNLTGEGAILGRRIEVNALHRDGTEFPVELTVTQVPGSDPALFTGYLRDITAARQASAALTASRERLAHIARTLQTSLLPPALPEIEGIELAAAFHAMGDGYEVGGDFYDAFELSDGRWALSLGDVCGKGSEAAVITALARYTLRAAAMRSSDPSVVLNTLNEAIHRQHPTQFCTVAYAILDAPSGTVELALGGHPHPFLLTASGHVHAVGTSGRLLGPLRPWQGSTESFTLGPGDTLLFYSDGLTEARAGSELFGEDRLIETLRAATGLSVTAVVQLIETTVLEYAGELNDDLAVLAVRRRPNP